MSPYFTTIATIVIHTPVWVWPLYALLLFLGFQRTRDRTVPLWRELILPLIVALLAIFSVIGAGLSGLPTTLLGLVIGGTAGWQLERDGATRRLPEGTLWLRGEWWSFAQIVLVLAFRYVRPCSERRPYLALEHPLHLRSPLGSVPRPHRGKAAGVLFHSPTHETR